jgi:hypothetical protein
MVLLVPQVQLVLQELIELQGIQAQMVLQALLVLQVLQV